MMLSYSCGNVVEKVPMAEDDGYVFLDSCASKRLFIVKDQSVLCCERWAMGYSYYEFPGWLD